MMRYIGILFFVLGLVFNVTAQTNVLSRALDHYKAGDLEKAKAAIDSTMVTENFNALPSSWYVRGFIYKDLYKSNTGNEGFRSAAIESFTKLLELDKEEKYTKEAKQNLKFLCVTYYNEGMRLIGADNPDLAKKSYEKFETLASTLNDAEISGNESKIRFQLALGSTFTKLSKNGSDKKQVEAAIRCYESVLHIDSLNREANYNIAVIHYNDAVNQILGLDYDALSLQGFSDFEDHIIDLFKKSLPFMKRAYKADPSDPNTLEGLAGIYFGLRDFDTSAKYKKQLGELAKK